ncbi:MAG: coproporphyrinogen III oxidase family protein [Chloroflexi bacterium]|nr:coproporphyrinogen III oxidase family protein [Chloroflexota bacterium]
MEILASIIGAVTRREGRKFLDLNPDFDERVVDAPGDTDDGQTLLYVHIPFCRTLCPFCCFNRYLFKEDETRQYFRHLKKELDMYIGRGFRFSDIYFGGGTPTILMDELTDFIAYLRRNFDVRRISLETTAREINPPNIKLLKAAGVNRLSIGVQSFDDATLKTMGRTFCSGEELKEKLRLAQGEFETLNIDFVFNFPGQSIEKFAEDVAIFKNMGIDQATFYPLMASPHKKNALERKFNTVDTAREKKFYDIILRELFEDGYKASTAWCFSRGEKMIDEYIVDFDDYIGIGAGSVSIFRGNFLINTFSLAKYGQLIDSDRLPVVGWRRLSDREYRRYYLLTKLTGMEIDPQKFQRRFHADIHDKLRLELTFLRLFGLVRGKDNFEVTRKGVHKDNFEVTRRGMYPVSVMMREFFAALNGLREDYIEKQI